MSALERFHCIAICESYVTADLDIEKTESEYALKNEEKLNHLLFMDDLKIFAKRNGLVSIVQILSNDIGIKFGIKESGVFILKRGKTVSSEGI